MQLEKILKAGTTTRRKALWDSVADLVVASQKVEGKNVAIREIYGQGTLINASRDRGSVIGTCLESLETIDLTLAGVSLCTDICVAEASDSAAVTTGGTGINTTLSLGVDVSGAPQWISYFHGGVELVHVRQFTSFNNCTGPEITNINSGFSVDCIKGMEGVLDGIYITAFQQNIAYYFIAHLSLCGDSISSVPNLLTACGDPVPTELQPWLGSTLAIGFGGTATISTPITSC